MASIRQALIGAADADVRRVLLAGDTASRQMTWHRDRGDTCSSAFKPARGTMRCSPASTLGGGSGTFVSRSQFQFPLAHGPCEVQDFFALGIAETQNRPLVLNAVHSPIRGLLFSPGARTPIKPCCVSNHRDTDRIICRDLTPCRFFRGSGTLMLKLGGLRTCALIFV